MQDNSSDADTIYDEELDFGTTSADSFWKILFTLLQIGTRELRVYSVLPIIKTTSS